MQTGCANFSEDSCKYVFHVYNACVCVYVCVETIFSSSCLWVYLFIISVLNFEINNKKNIEIGGSEQLPDNDLLLPILAITFLVTFRDLTIHTSVVFKFIFPYLHISQFLWNHCAQFELKFYLILRFLRGRWWF